MYPIRRSLACRACGSNNVKTVLGLRPMPPGDKYVSNHLDVPLIDIPSDIIKCEDCSHIQMSGSTDPDYIYETYLSRPASTNPQLEAEYKKYASELVELAGGGPILEVGSNDGLFLSFIRDCGGRAIGIEPASNLVKIANTRDISTINDYVSRNSVDLAVELLGSKPSLILANHSFSNVEDIVGWASLLSEALIDDGHLVLQTFYQYDVLEKHMIENYNHEHLSYVTITWAQTFFRRFGLNLTDVCHLDAKGGSIRLFFRKSSSNHISERALLLISSEQALSPSITGLFKATEEYIASRTGAIHHLLSSNFSENCKVAAYGTSIGATVFSYQFQLDSIIDCFFDDDPLRQGRYSPGTGKLVYPGRGEEMLNYSVIIILAPLYADAIIRNNEKYLLNGGAFIRFWPEPQLITKDSLPDIK
jgi:hypothetical protein